MPFGTVDVVIDVATELEIETRVVELFGRLMLGTRRLDIRRRGMQHRIVAACDLKCLLQRTGQRAPVSLRGLHSRGRQRANDPLVSRLGIEQVDIGGDQIDLGTARRAT